MSMDDIDFIEWEASLITDEEIELRLALLLLKLGYQVSNLEPRGPVPRALP
jgi:hypothetical protein